uniref:PORR domain-containing protein n=1 Tax=Nelumbo nucifera TaxID=4432 RepID=A0A822ZKN5_NELNU|nr:TPA_asm: hypothetical protein HUJ06_002361 [Nelumbo nucifera]
MRNEMADLLVVKLRKLLMMSLEKRIPLEKTAHLRTDLGLPSNSWTPFVLDSSIFKIVCN